MGPIQKEDQDMAMDPWLAGSGNSAPTCSSRNGPDDVGPAIGEAMTSDLAALMTTPTAFGVNDRQR